MLDGGKAFSMKIMLFLCVFIIVSFENNKDVVSTLLISLDKRSELTSIQFNLSEQRMEDSNELKVYFVTLTKRTWRDFPTLIKWNDWEMETVRLLYNGRYNPVYVMSWTMVYMTLYLQEDLFYQFSFEWKGKMRRSHGDSVFIEFKICLETK